jgi:hypothetical protein
MPAFQATGSSKPGEDSLPQPPYIVLDPAPIHGVPIEDLALRSVHLHGVQLAHRFRHLQSAAPHRLTRPTSAPFRVGHHARIRPVMRQPFGGGADTRVPGFLSPFDRRHSLLGSSCARWGVAPSSRSAYRRRSAGPQRGCHVAHEQDSTGQGAPFTPGTVVRSRPATILRPAPAASQRPVPTAPLTHPIGGGHLHEASSGVHSRSPITSRWLAATPEPESETASRRSSPRPRPPDGTAVASASTPGFAPRGHPRSTPGRRQALHALARVLHLRHQPNLQTVPPTSLMHPHVAHSPRWTPR